MSLKKGRSDSGTLHLFEAIDVRRAAPDEAPESVCGNYEHDGTFTGAPDPGDLDALCERCEAAAGD